MPTGWVTIIRGHGHSPWNGRRFLSSLVSLGTFVSLQPHQPRKEVQSHHRQSAFAARPRQPGRSTGEDCAYPGIHPGVGDGGCRGVACSQGVFEEGRECRENPSSAGADRPCARVHQESAEEAGECRRQDCKGRAGVAVRPRGEGVGHKGDRRERSTRQATSRRGRSGISLEHLQSVGRPRHKLHNFREMVHLHSGLRGEDRTEGGEPCKKRLREDYIPMSTEDLVQWMGPSEGFARGHVKWENPRCDKIGAVGRRERSSVEDVDGRKSRLHGRPFCEHGATSAAFQRRVQHGFRGVRVGEASNPGPDTQSSARQSEACAISSDDENNFHPPPAMWVDMIRSGELEPGRVRRRRRIAPSSSAERDIPEPTQPASFIPTWVFHLCQRKC